MKTRLYRIARAGSDDAALVRAGNKEQALRHCARNVFVASVATDQDIYDLALRGVKIEDASAANSGPVFVIG